MAPPPASIASISIVEPTANSQPEPMDPPRPLDDASKTSSLTADTDGTPQATAAASVVPSVAFDVPSDSEPDDKAATGNACRRRSTLDEDRETDLPGLLALLGEDDYEVFEVAPGSGVRKLDTPPDMKSFRTHKRPFIIRRKTAQKIAQEQAQFTGGPAPQVADGEIDQLDYEKRFRPDERGKEKDPNARVWRVYLNEAGQFDINMIENMRDTVDVILVFSALFSAIVTTLVALTATALQLDHPQVTNRLLMELIALQRIAITSGSIDQVDPSPLNADSLPSSTASVADYWVNGLWFTSLAFSLSTALIAVLVRQWIQAYEAPSFQGTAKARAEVRGFRYYGIEKWHVPLIIGLLPTLLHLSLFLFFGGLVVFLFTLSHTIAYVVTGIISAALVAYVITNLLPVWFASCPYRTPLSTYVFAQLRSCKARYSWLWDDMIIDDYCLPLSWKQWWEPAPRAINVAAAQARRAFRVILVLIYLPAGLAIRLPWYLKTRSRYRSHFSDFLDFLLQPLQYLRYNVVTHPLSLKEMETKAIQESGDSLHTRMFVWLMQTSPNPSARAIITSCIALNHNDLVYIQPPITSMAEWAKTLQQAISAQVTSPRSMLHAHSFELYTHLIGEDWDQLKLVKPLVSVHLYCQTSATHFLEEQTYNISSTVDWNEYAMGPKLAGETFLHRFCIHALYHATPDSESAFAIAALLQKEPALPPLYSAMRAGSRSIKPTPAAVRRLKSWLPTPNQADLLQAVTAPQLQLLLEVAAFLLGTTDSPFCDVFKDTGCLLFWRRVFNDHHGVISQDVVNAFSRMMRCYALSYTDSYKQHVLDHLLTVCIWEATRRGDDLPWHITYLVNNHWHNPAWQEVQDTLLDHLPTDEAKEAGVAFLQKLRVYRGEV